MLLSSSVRPQLRQFAAGRIEVVPVQSPADMRRFLEFPYEHYHSDPYWVAPLRSDQRELLDTAKHPFYRHAAMQCFLACSKDRVCGRIAAIVDHGYNAARGQQVGAFGFYESIDSEAVAGALFQSAKEWLVLHGATVLRGPLNPSINYECGVLVDGFDCAPSVMTTYNPPYYQRLFEDVGLEKVRDLYAYRLVRGEDYEVKMDRLSRAARINPVSGLRIRSVDLARFDRDVESVWRIHSNAWRDNWGAAPASLEETLYTGRQLKPILIPKLALFAEIGGEPVAFGLVVPDINQALKHIYGSLFPLGLLKLYYYKSKITKLRVLSLGVVERHRNSGVAAHLYAALVRNALELGYSEAECSWILEDNRAMNRTLKFLGAEQHKTYRIYEAPLADICSH